MTAGFNGVDIGDRVDSNKTRNDFLIVQILLFGRLMEMRTAIQAVIGSLNLANRFIYKQAFDDNFN